MQRTLLTLLIALSTAACGDDTPNNVSTEDTDVPSDAGGDSASGQVDGGDNSGQDASGASDDVRTSNDASSPTDTQRADTSDEDVPEGDDGTISIYLAGDLSARAWDDGLSGQTADAFSIAIGRYAIQTSANDPNPQLCFDHGEEPAVADIHTDNLVGVCPIRDLPTGLYSHGRVKVDWVRYTVTGTLHYLGVAYPGQFTFFRAYSDTAHEGRTYRANEGWVEYSGLIDVEIPWSFPDLPSAPGIRTELTNGEFWMIFPYTRPLPIVQSNNQSHWARFNWEIYESFRWRDSNALGYVDGIWDVATVFGDSEAVLVPGASGYTITSSLD